MDGDRLMMAAGVTAAVVVGAFVFWGPSGQCEKSIIESGPTGIMCFVYANVLLLKVLRDYVNEGVRSPDCITLGRPAS